MRCLYLTQELAPYFMEGGLGQTARALPTALERDHDLVHDLVVPYYPWLVAHHGLRTERVAELPPVTVGGVTASATIERLVGGDEPTGRDGPGQLFLVRADHWYDRAGIYRDAEYVEFTDATARAAFFGRCVADWLATADRGYDLVHGNDWQSGAALAQLRSARGTSRRPALLLNVHSAEYVGRIEPDATDRLALPDPWPGRLAGYGREASLLLLGLLAADAVTTGSPSYAEELAADTAGTALGAALARLPLTGIVAGIDDTVWQPTATGRPTVPYDAENVREGKSANKLRLQRRLGLKTDPDVPLFGVCTRLVAEKGVDLLVEAAAPMVLAGTAQLVVVGQGDSDLVAALDSLAWRAPLGACHVPRFDQESAWLVYAGSDFTVMPSRVEPCGLNQLIAMAYGTVPLVSAVGGLRDTVTDLAADRTHGTGFVLPALTSAAVGTTMAAAARWLTGPNEQVDPVRRRVMTQDWSWARSARDTAALYRRTTSTAGQTPAP